MAPFTECTLTSALGPVQLTALSLEDLAEIDRLEQSSSANPWSTQNIHSSLSSSHRAIGLKFNNQLLAHAFISLASVEAELLLIAVSKKYQGRGLGRLFLSTLIEQLAGHAEELFLEVRPSNLSAVALYESLGFNQIGVRKGYYPGPKGGEEAWVFGLSIFAD